MGRFLGSVFGLRREERDIALLMATYHFLLLVTLYLLKPVRDSLFLSSRGPTELPFVFVLTTVVVAPVATLHARAGNQWDVGHLIDGVSVFLALSLLGLRGLLAIGGEWVAYVLYAWVSVYGLLVTSQFWLLANTLFTSSQAKRVFTVLSAGAILGAIIGGEITGILVDVVGMSSENLLWVAGGVLLASSVLGRWIRAYYREKTGERPGETETSARRSSPSGALSTLRESRHLKLIVSIIALMVVVTTFVDFQFKTVAARAYSNEADLTSFMGQFYGRVSIIALLLQFVLAPQLMRVVGIGGALSVLPGALALGSMGMLLVPGLATGILLRGAGQSLKHSVDKTGRELLFVPVPLEKKKRVKVFVDTFIDQGAEGLGGLLLLGLVVGAGVSVQLLSLFTLVLIGIWSVLAYRARQSYVDQYRSKLRQQEEATDEESEDDKRPEADLDELLDALCSHAETEVLHALDQFEKGTMSVPVDALLCLSDHPSPSVRQRVIRVFRVREVEDVAEDVAEALRDSDPDVQLEAARYLYCQETGSRIERLRQGLQHDDPHIQAAAVGLIAEEGDPKTYELVDESLLRRLVALGGEANKDTRTHVARILGVLDRPYRNELLRRLLNDEASQVVRAAIKSAGRTAERTFVPPLVRFLNEDAYADPAQEALASFGAPIQGTLYDYLIDGGIALQIRRRIPPIFVAHPCQLAFSLLIRSLETVSIPVRQAVVRALSRLHKTGDYESPTERLDTAIKREAEHFAVLGQLLHLPLSTDGNHASVPIEELRIYREETLERIFRLLGLRYDQRDIYNAYLGITSADASLQDSAIEFVDNLVNYKTRRYLLPLIDDPDGEQASKIGREVFSQHVRHWEEARDYLKNADDPRLSALVESMSPESTPDPEARPEAPRHEAVAPSQSVTE